MRRSARGRAGPRILLASALGERYEQEQRNRLYHRVDGEGRQGRSLEATDFCRGPTGIEQPTLEQSTNRVRFVVYSPADQPLTLGSDDGPGERGGVSAPLRLPPVGGARRAPASAALASG